MKKHKLAWVLVLAFLLVGAVAVASAMSETGDPTFTQVWDGRGADSLNCAIDGEDDPRNEFYDTGWIHWVFSTKGRSTSADLTLGGTGVGVYYPGHPLNANVWHFYTPYYDVEGLTAVINLYGGSPGRGGGLVISDWCPGEFESLDVSKTAVTTYTREHFWDIDKKVETDNGFVHKELPKIWLYADGSGDEAATWTVDVTYLGYEDYDHNVSGVITIFNDGQLPAVITAVDDVLAGMPIVVDCGVMFPYTLPVGDTLTCTYDEDVAYKVEGFNEVTVITERADYFANAPIIWGAPALQYKDVVTVKDSNDTGGVLPATLYAADYAAGEVISFTYSQAFAWADYGKDNCGAFLYKNTAWLVGTKQTANAALRVNVQCLIFKGETAWGGDTGFNIISPGQWWYIFDTAGAATQTIWAGQTINVGHVTVSDVMDGNRTITMVLTGDWELKEDAEPVKIQGYNEIPGSAPSPGLFTTYKGTSLVVVVPDYLYYAIHLDVGQWIPDPNFGP